MKPLMKENKAQFLGIMLFIILAFIIVIISIIFVYVSQQMDTAMKEKFIELDAENTTAINMTKNLEETFHQVPTQLTTLYWATTLLILGLVMGIFVGAFYIVERPILFIPYIFFMIAAVIVANELSNAYTKFITESAGVEGLTAVINNFVGANYIMAYLPIWVAILGFAGAAIMFVNFKRRFGT